jgi:hypothetical protein
MELLENLFDLMRAIAGPKAIDTRAGVATAYQNGAMEAIAPRSAPARNSRVGQPPKPKPGQPCRGPHDALDALCVAIDQRRMRWIIDADIQNFFGAASQEWLVRFLEYRIGDKRVICLIRKWQKAGILEDGIVSVDDKGTGQGSVVSPLPGNIYLHYALDLWAKRWRQRKATGDMIIVRYADDLIVGFEREVDARRFLAAIRSRLEA